MTAMRFLRRVILLLLVWTATAPSTGVAEQGPISNFLKSLLQAERSLSERKSARGAGDAGGDLYYGARAEARLLSAIQRYEEIARRGGWPTVEFGPPLRVGDTDGRIATIRKRLIASGDLPGSKKSHGTEFDKALHDAVVRFQTRHGLPNEGYLGKLTIAALNVSADVRLGQLRTNRERMRQLAGLEAERRTVLVNVPAYELQAIENGEVVFASRVVAGRPDRQTPMISARVLGVDILPTWRVPPGITKRDMMPKLQKDPDYFTRENFRVIRASDGVAVNPRSIDWSSPVLPGLRFEQAPGPANALGLIRIDMPNSQTVYLHDTPLKKLFARSSRPFSSGCVRVEKIGELALWLTARQTGWDSSKLTAIVEAGKPKTVKLADPVPVHFIYLTSWVEPDGDVNFREDVYKKDRASPGAEAYLERSLPTQPPTP